MQKGIARWKMKKFLGLIVLICLLSACNAYESVNVTNVKSVDFKGMVNNKIRLALKIPVENPNWYKIKIKSMDFDVHVDGKYLGKLKNVEPIVIPRKSNHEQTFLVDIHVKNILGSMATFYKLKNKPNAEMELKGKMKVKALLSSKTIDISEKHKIKL